MENFLKNWSIAFLIGLLASVIFVSCHSVKTLPENHTKKQDRQGRNMLLVFMDGTRDMPDKKNINGNSHVKNSHALVYPGIPTLYVEGVGAGNMIKDAKYATTTAERVMRAYHFIIKNYRQNDSICLFGFSRGANQCRILSGLIYIMGIANLDNIKDSSTRHDFLLALYNQYSDNLGASCRKKKLALFVNTWNQSNPGQTVSIDTSGSVKIELMGLWDTVEALIINDSLEVPTPVAYHLNQLYNVNKLYHAVSLDDNRAFNYTPILATHKAVDLLPGQDINDIVEEVWFNGSHKDVGGGKKKKAPLTGISLRWMLSRVKPYNIFRDTVISPDIYGKANDMRRNPAMRKLSPGDTLRAINKYWQAMNPSWNGHRIKVHQSVIDRLAMGVVQDFKTKRGRPDWYDWEPFNACFTREGGRRIFNPRCIFIEVVNDCL